MLDVGRIMMRKRPVIYVIVLAIAVLAMRLLRQHQFPYSIRAADPDEYQLIQEWRNPWITVGNDSVLVRSQEVRITTQPNRLAAVLRRLPARHWPHGRVVVMNPGHDVVLDPSQRKDSDVATVESSARHQDYWKQCRDVIEELDISINRWPM